MKMRTIKALVAASFLLIAISCNSQSPTTSPSAVISAPTVSAADSAGSVKASDNGFDQYGYNRTARVFNGPASGWCRYKYGDPNCLGAYSNDKLVMKWNAEWDRGNAEGWNDPNGYRAWENNNWNGTCEGCSGAVWQTKIKWIGACTEGERFADGGYCIWGQFEVVMDKGHDPGYGPALTWFAKATAGGYGH